MFGHFYYRKDREYSNLWTSTENQSTKVKSTHVEERYWF